MIDAELKALVGRIKLARAADVGFHLSDDDLDALLNAAENFAKVQGDISGHLLRIGELERSNIAFENTLREMRDVLRGHYRKCPLGDA